jgi:ATP-binding cassette subfamily B protein
MMITTGEIKHSLQSSSYFSDLPSDTLTLLAEVLEIESFTAGETVCVVGETADRIYIVHKGSLAVYIAGRSEPVSMLGPGAVMGEYGMFTGVRTGTVKAEDAAVLLSMDYPRFKAFLIQNPASLYELFGVTVARLLSAEKLVLSGGGTGHK